MSERSDVPADLARLLAIQRAVQRLALSPDAPEDPAATFVRAGVDPADARALGSFSPERTAVYGWLVGRTVLTAIQNQLPATARRLPEEQVASLARRFLEEAPPRSPYLRDVPFEFAMWAAAHWRSGGVPPYLPDLARFELLAFAVGSAEAGPRPAAPEPLAADRGVWLDGSVHLARFDHAVHLLFDGGAEDREPDARSLALLMYRDHENEIRWIEMAPLAAEVLVRLLAGAPLGMAIREAAGALGREMDAGLIEAISGVLSDLAGRGALLGASPAGDAAPERADSSPYRQWLAAGKEGI
jgi:hypothetical protein